MSKVSSSYILAETLFYSFRGETDLLNEEEIARSGIEERPGHMTNVMGIEGVGDKDGRRVRERLSLDRRGNYHFTTTFTEIGGTVVHRMITPGSDKNYDDLQDSLFVKALDNTPRLW